MSGLFSRLWATWRRQSRYFVGEDLEGNRYFEIPTKRTGELKYLVRPTRRVEYARASHDVTQNANRARQLPVDFMAFVHEAGSTDPAGTFCASYTILELTRARLHGKELQADILRRQRLHRNVQMIEARDREERERQMVAQAGLEPLRVAAGNQLSVDSNLKAGPRSVDKQPKVADEQPRAKDVEDPWEKAKKEAPAEQPSSWQPQVSRRSRS